MTTIVLSYKGKCDFGPWAGQRIEAERSIVRHEMLNGGAYRWRDGVWKWKPPESLNGQAQEKK